jgi:hypothetical protein
MTLRDEISRIVSDDKLTAEECADRILALPAMRDVKTRDDALAFAATLNKPLNQRD